MSSDPLTELGTSERGRLEAFLVDFDLSWRPGRLAVAVDRLPANGPFRRAAIRELVKIDLERQARNGRPIPLSDYLRQYPDLLDAGNVPTDLVRAEAAVNGESANLSETSPIRARPPQIPEIFGRYRVLRPLGHGGMGSVYLVRDTELDRLVALKVPHLAPSDPEAMERFAREARAAATIDHPNVCHIYDVGRVEDIPYLTMAYVEGPSLADELRAGPLPTRRAVEIARDVARALAEAHRRGVIHRDLKPANILIGPNGQPVVTDFGLARREADDLRMTDPGTVLGTPLYMSPEQVSGDTERIGPASDVYSLGVVLYEMLTGRPPFTGSRTDVLAQALTKLPPAPSLHQANVDPELDRLNLRALAKAPGDRFTGMTEFADALDRWLHSSSPKSATNRKLLFWLTTSAVALLILSLLPPLSVKLGWISDKQEAHNAPKVIPVFGGPDSNPQPPRRAEPKSLYLGKYAGGAKDRLLAVALTEDGERVQGAITSDGWISIHAWNATTGEEETGKNHRSLHGWATFSPNGRWFLVGDGLSNIEFGRVGSDRMAKAIPAGSNSKTGAISLDGRRVLSGFWSLKDGDIVKVWDVETGESVGRDIGYKNPAKCAALSDDGRWAFAASPDRAAIWEIGAGKPAVVIQKNSVLCAAFAPGTIRVYVGTEYGRIQVFEPPAAEPVRAFDDRHTDAIASLALSPNGELVATGGDDGTVRIWNAATGKEQWKLDAHSGRVVSVAFAANGHRLVSAGVDTTWHVWELAD